MPETGDRAQIELSMSGGAGSTGIDARDGFNAATRIVMRIHSTNSTNGKDNLYTRTVAKAEAAGSKEYSTVTFTGDYRRYWDDAHGRESKLAVYAVSLPDLNDEGALPEDILPLPNLSGTKLWGTEATMNNQVKWTLTTDQTGLVAKQDLTYSNNIRETGANGVYRYDFGEGKYVPETYPGDANIDDLNDGVMQFIANPGGVGGKFDHGHLIFKHSLSRIIVKLKKGEGFAGTPAPFAFTKSGENVKINNITLTDESTYLDITDGTWHNALADRSIKKMSELATPDAGIDRQLVAQVIPGDKFPDGGSTKRIEMEIDDNTYYITDAMLYNAFSTAVGAKIESNNLVFEQGKEYEITITVSKKRIDDITATIVPWSNVVGQEMTVNNAYISLELYNPTGTAIEGAGYDLHIYRKNDPSAEISIDGSFMHYDWYTGYEKGTLSWNDDHDHWETEWFFENNKAFYHLRMTNVAAGSDSYTIATGTKDTWWGAPMKNGASLEYDFTNDNKNLTDPTNNGGYSSSLYWGIGATEDQIKITMLHTKSDINVVLKTTTGPDAVNLDNAVVKVVRSYTAGTVELGRGMVVPTGSLVAETALNLPGTYYKTPSTETNPFNLLYIPQSLKRGSADSDYVGIEIRTTDGNIYKINRLSEINVEGSATPIDRWVPNHSYTYTFTLTKTGIKNLTATITNWKEVKADDTPVVIE